MALTTQEVKAISDQMLTAALNGDKALLDALMERVGHNTDALGVVAASVHDNLADNGVSTQSPVGLMVGALCSNPDIRLRFLTDRTAVLTEFGLIGDQLQAFDLDNQDMEAIQGAGYTNP